MLKRICLFLIGILSVNATIQGVNLYGFETPLRDITCSWKHPIEYYIDEAVKIGFNSIRLPFSGTFVTAGDFSKFDKFIDYATNKNVSILLDYHRVDERWQSANPFEKLSLTEFVNQWTTVLNRYKDNVLVNSIGLFNEFQGNEDQGDYWSDMCSQVIDKIELVFPNRFLYLVGGTQWGGNLFSIDLEGHPWSDRIRYEAHKYHFSGSGTREDWDHSLGNKINKVIIGEWAINREAWDNRFIEYLIEKNIRNNYYWTLSNSYDTINIWENDCETINWDVVNQIKRLWDTKRYLRGYK